MARQGDATVYLFGTVHALKPELKWETPKIEKAFAESREVWLEIEDPSPDPKAIQPLLRELGFDEAHPLSTKLGAADVKRLDAAAKSAGLPGEAALETMRPWLASVTIEALPIIKAGYDPAKGVDVVLRGKADAAGKPVHGLETLGQQMHLFADMPPKVELSLLRSTLDEVDQAPNMLATILEAWQRGDDAAVDTYINDVARKYRDLYAILIVNRNRAWAERIARHLKSGQGAVFVAVGAGHLVGHDSVQEALKARGIAVARAE